MSKRDVSSIEERSRKGRRRLKRTGKDVLYLVRSCMSCVWDSSRVVTFMEGERTCTRHVNVTL